MEKKKGCGRFVLWGLGLFVVFVIYAVGKTKSTVPTAVGVSAPTSTQAPQAPTPTPTPTPTQAPQAPTPTPTPTATVPLSDAERAREIFKDYALHNEAVRDYFKNGVAADAKYKPVAVSATELLKDYHANEVSGDDKYKGRLLKVTGEVGAIRKDAFDTVIVELATPNQFLAVHTYGIPSKIAGMMAKGDKYGLLCKGGGMILGSPVLRECLLVNLDD